PARTRRCASGSRCPAVLATRTRARRRPRPSPSTPSRPPTPSQAGPARQMKRLRRALEILLTGYVLVVLGLGIAAHAAPVVGYGLYAVRTASMTPALKVGDLVVEERVDPAKIQVGDVITLATANGATVTHRVETVTPNDAGPVFTTRGDANASPDPVA